MVSSSGANLKKKNKNEDHVNKAYLGIRQMLFHGELSSGQKISPRDIADHLQMSPTPVIQALKFLEFKDLVRHVSKRGYYTQPLNLNEVEEIYELRELLEVALLEKTIRNLEQTGIDKLRKAFDDYLKAAEKVYNTKIVSEAHLTDELMKDMDFHLTLASLSGTTLYRNMLRNLFDLFYLKYRGRVLFLARKGNVDVEHKKIFESVLAKDIKKSQTALSKHIRNVKKHVLTGLNHYIKEKQKTSF